MSTQGGNYIHWSDSPADVARKEFLTRVHGKNDEPIDNNPIWPFVHGYPGVQAEFPGYKISSWGLDPLIIPLLVKLNNIGIETYSSCQGTDTHCPCVHLTTDLDGASKILSLFDNMFSDQMTLFLVQYHEGEASWVLSIRDTFSLIKFNRNILEVSVEKQLEIPLWTAEMQKILGATPEQHREDMLKFQRVTAEEIEAILEVKYTRP